MNGGLSGDLAEYGKFVRRYSPALFRYCFVDRPIGTVTAALSHAYRKLRERHSDDTRED